MPNVSAAIFVAKHLEREEVRGKRVLDVGSCNYNGSVAPLIQSWHPEEYLGVDVVEGPGVDLVCGAEDLLKTFGKQSFDIVLCIEVLEHAKDWRETISNLKQVLKPGGKLLLTTRSCGYPVHGFPHDFWRFERTDFEILFSDLENRVIESDPIEPGIFVVAARPSNFEERDLSAHAVYSVLMNERCIQLPENLAQLSYFRRLRLKQGLRALAYRMLLGAGRLCSKLFGLARAESSSQALAHTREKTLL